VYVFTGNGKGKTSAALGTALRGVARDWQVDWIAWYKNVQWDISEYRLPDLLPKGNLEMFALGQGFFIKEPEQVVNGKVKIASVNSAKVSDNHTPDEHHAAAQAALHFAQERLAKHPEILVLDEICNAIEDGLVQEDDVLALLQQRGSTHIVLTGRSASDSLIEAADLVSEIISRKHPYESGKLAVAGLDF
jgi:cob(I)alamin adenosyltransferase